jgi:hypothetical protein
VRIAVIACSPYSACQKVTELSSAEVDVDLLGQRLSEADAGFVVHSFRAERGLAEAVDQVLSEASEPVDEFLFYFAGYAVLNDERGPALLLDGERLSAFSLKRLRRVLAERARSSLCVLDTVPAFDGQMSPKDAVNVLGAALAEPGSNVHLVASSRPESQADRRSPFANLFELVLDWQSVSGSPVRIDTLFSAMRAEEAMFAEVPAAEYFAGAEPFELLRPVPPPLWSEPPPSVSEQPAPSTDRDPIPFARLPSEITPTNPRGFEGSAHVGKAEAERAQAEKAATEPARELPAVAPPPSDGDATIPDAAAVASPATEPSAEPATAPAAEAAAEPSADAPPPPPPMREREVSGIELVPGAVPKDAPAAEPPKQSVPPPLPKRKPPAAKPPLVEPSTAPPTPEALRALELERLTESMADGRTFDAVTHARAALRIAPRDAQTYRALNMLFEKLGRPDGCWNVACVLDACGMADVNESLLAGLHRPEGLIAAKGVLGEEDWGRRLLYPERDPTLDALFVALGGAAVEVGAETARRKRRLPVLDAETEQDPAKSTTTLARTLVWSARLLGIPTPALYVVDGAPGELTPAPTVASAVLASKSLGSGLELPELAFLWARRLVMFRPEHRIAALLPNAAELEDFVRAAQVLGLGNDRSFKRLEGDSKLFARGLKRHLRVVDRAGFEAAARRISRESIAPMVSAYRRSIELAAGRAGLLASGELGLALKMTDRFPQYGPASLDEQKADLLTYAVSDEYAALRERLGVAVRS